jgi:hypothetical protein
MLRGAVFHSRILAKHKKTVSRHENGSWSVSRISRFPTLELPIQVQRVLISGPVTGHPHQLLISTGL